MIALASAGASAAAPVLAPPKKERASRLLVEADALGET